MSNRVRLFFSSTASGAQEAHIGRHVLAAMERLVQTPTAKFEWIEQAEWLRRGKPKFMEKMLDFSGTSAEAHMVYMYKVPILSQQQSLPLPVPAIKDKVRRAKWLWQNLPSDVRQQSQLVVTRESRKAAWKGSRANPARYGLGKAGGKQGKPKTHFYTTFSTVTAGIGNLLDPMQYVVPPLLPVQGGWEAPPNPPAPASKPAGKGTLSLPVKKAVETSPYLDFDQVKKVKAQVQAKWEKEQLVRKKPKVHFMDEDGNETEEPYAEPAEPKQAAKPRLRLGIWS